MQNKFPNFVISIKINIPRPIPIDSRTVNNCVPTRYARIKPAIIKIIGIIVDILLNSISVNDININPENK
ncbi:MAG: hypothetical protein ACYCTB_09845 [bacterium]